MSVVFACFFENFNFQGLSNDTKKVEIRLKKLNLHDFKTFSSIFLL